MASLAQGLVDRDCDLEQCLDEKNSCQWNRWPVPWNMLTQVFFSIPLYTLSDTLVTADHLRRVPCRSGSQSHTRTHSSPQEPFEDLQSHSRSWAECPPQNANSSCGHTNEQPLPVLWTLGVSSYGQPFAHIRSNSWSPKSKINPHYRPLVNYKGKRCLH